MPRLFVALDPPDAARRAVKALRNALDGARWSPPENYHLTLRFLGDVEGERVTEVEEALARVDAAPAIVQPAGLIVLPSRRHPRVLAVAFERTEGLMALYEQVEEAMHPLGFEPETRRFRPHLTFARLKEVDRQAVVRYLRSRDVPDVTFTATTFHLYESELRPDGARHHRRATYEFVLPAS